MALDWSGGCRKCRSVITVPGIGPDGRDEPDMICRGCQIKERAARIRVLNACQICLKSISIVDTLYPICARCKKKGMGYAPSPPPSNIVLLGPGGTGRGYYLESRIRDWEQGRNIPKVADLFTDDGSEPYWITSYDEIKEMDLAEFTRKIELESSKYYGAKHQIAGINLTDGKCEAIRGQSKLLIPKK